MTTAQNLRAATMPAADSSTTGKTVLLVEDESDLNELLTYSLKKDGFKVLSAESGEQGVKLLSSHQPDMILLDLMLPGIDGLEVCRLVKENTDTAEVPVIMLTAKGEESDIVRGLEMGADDYITKPFSPKVLNARIRAVLRRAQSEAQPAGNSNIITCKEVTIDLDRHEVRVYGELAQLTATEFKLLTLLIGKPGRVFTRQGIIQMIHEGFAAVTDRSVDVQVVALRRKLGDAGSHIETVRGVGYRFRD